MAEQPSLRSFKGRGAATNQTGRFETLQREAFDDGWLLEDEAAVKLETIVGIETARTALSYNDSPDLSFDRAINTYRGCEHGCIYCYARPNHAYAGLSPGVDFESRLFVKANAAEALERELAAPSYRPQTVVLGGVTDCYQPLERERKVTRAVLEVLARAQHPVAIVTKSALVERDLDLLAPMAAAGLAKAAISLTSLDRSLSRRMEPRAAAPHRRLKTIARLSEAGVPVTVMTAPLIPDLNDHELEGLLKAAAGAGAQSAGYILLRLPLEIEQLFQEWLAQHYPERAKRVMSLVRQTRGGKAYDPRFGIRQRGEGPYAGLLAQRFKRALQHFGLTAPRLALRTDLFTPPTPPGRTLRLL